MWVITQISGGSRIFLRKGRLRQRGDVNLLFDQFFFRKLHENEEILGQREHAPLTLTLRSATADCPFAGYLALKADTKSVRCEINEE